ncbi:MAG: hypothetical protein U0V74_03940 [Chitinophagales bacterium]
MKKILPILLLALSLSATAQTKLDSLETRVNKMDKLLGILREFRISGYIQPEFQYTDTVGAAGYEGGDFAPNTNNRFTLRRGRFKLGWEHESAKGFKVVETVFQMDMTERGVAIRDFYGRVIDPWTGWVGIQGGLFNRPFGFEVPFSSGSRETPERGRMSQILFPGERDLGAALVIESPHTFKPVYVRLDAAVVNGNGTTFSEFDKYKDFIGHLQARKTIGDKLKFTVSGGVSFYNGGVLQSTPNVYTISKDGTDFLHYTKQVDSGAVGKKYYARRYYGADLQLGLDYKIGTTTLRGEFIAGQQPGTSTATTVPTAVGNDLYIRKFNGAYFYFIQTFKNKLKSGHTMYHDFVFKYDWYDPNAQIAGKDLSTAFDARDSRADVRYQSFEVAYIFRPYDWFKLMIHYDIVKNEKTNIAGYNRDLKDNVLTIRTQFTFDSNWFKK